MLQFTSVTILDTQDTSNVCDTGINQVVGFVFPTMVSTSFFIDCSFDGQNFYRLADSDGTEITITNNNSNNYIYLKPEVSYAMPRFIRLEGDETETADAVIQVVMREV